MLTRPPAYAASNIKGLISTEALLFLYPRWFQQQCRASARISRTGRPLSTGKTTPRQAAKPDNLRSPRRCLHTPASSQEDAPKALPAPKQSKTVYDRRNTPDRTPHRTIAAPKPDRVLRKQLADRDVHRILNPLAAASANVQDQLPSRETIEVPAKVLIAIAATAKPNMWIHHAGSGCAVHVLRSAIADSDFRCVELIGAPVSIAAARDYLLCYKIVDKQDDEPSQMAAKWDKVLHVHDILRPEQWSVRSFYRYVGAVLSHKPRPFQRRSIYGSDEYANTVSQLLQSLFSSAQDSSAYASVAALRLVLNFHREHRGLSDSVSSFWYSAIALGLAPDVGCYNQELARLISLQKVDTAVRLLHDMRKANVSPDTDTWRIVLGRAENDEAQQKILGALKMLGLMDTPSQQAKASTALARKIGPRFDSHLDSFDELAEYMEHCIGSEWFSTSTLNRLLRTCLISSGPVRFDSAMAIMNKSQQSGHGQSLWDAQTVSLLIEILAKAGRMDDAFSLLLTSVHLRHTREHDTQITAALFNLALRKKLVNSARVLWCYAATTADMKFRIQSKMRGYLKYNDSHKEFEHWRNMAASFIVCNEIDTRHFERVFPKLLPSVSPLLVRTTLSTRETNSQRRHEQKELARFLMSRDVNLWRLYWPMEWHTFLECLGKAIQMDHNQPKLDTISDLANSVLINIPLVEREEPIPTNLEVRWETVNEHVYDRNTFSFLDESFLDGSADSADIRVSTNEHVDEQMVGEVSKTDGDASDDMKITSQLGASHVPDGSEVQATDAEDEGRESHAEPYDLHPVKRESTATQR